LSEAARDAADLAVSANTVAVISLAVVLVVIAVSAIIDERSGRPH
jgi:hypothetical protein